jgi:hypothetical protein
VIYRFVRRRKRMASEKVAILSTGDRVDSSERRIAILTASDEFPEWA